MQILEVEPSILGEHVSISHRGSAIILSDRAVTGSYKLSIVTMLLIKTVRPQFALLVFGVQLAPIFGENKNLVCRETDLVPQSSRQTTLFICSGSFQVKCAI